MSVWDKIKDALTTDDADRPDPASFLPELRKRVYDIHPVITAVLDEAERALPAEAEGLTSVRGPVTAWLARQ